MQLAAVRISFSISNDGTGTRVVPDDGTVDVGRDPDGGLFEFARGTHRQISCG